MQPPVHTTLGPVWDRKIHNKTNTNWPGTRRMISLSWKTPCPERPHGSLVALYRLICLFLETYIRSAISSISLDVVLHIELSSLLDDFMAWKRFQHYWSLIVWEESPPPPPHTHTHTPHPPKKQKKTAICMSAWTSQNAGDLKRRNCNECHDFVSVHVTQPLWI